MFPHTVGHRFTKDIKGVEEVGRVGTREGQHRPCEKSHGVLSSTGPWIYGVNGHGTNGIAIQPFHVSLEMQQFCYPHYYHFIVSLVLWVMWRLFRFFVFLIYCRLFLFDCICHTGLWGVEVTKFEKRHLKCLVVDLGPRAL